MPLQIITIKCLLVISFLKRINKDGSLMIGHTEWKDYFMLAPIDNLDDLLYHWRYATVNYLFHRITTIVGSWSKNDLKKKAGRPSLTNYTTYLRKSGKLARNIFQEIFYSFYVHQKLDFYKNDLFQRNIFFIFMFKYISYIRHTKILMFIEFLKRISFEKINFV